MEKLVESQKNNSVNVTISSCDTCSPAYPDVLVAFIDYVKQGKNRRSYMADSSLNIDSPFSFISRACKRAERIAKKLAKAQGTVN